MRHRQARGFSTHHTALALLETVRAKRRTPLSSNRVDSLNCGPRSHNIQSPRRVLSKLTTLEFEKSPFSQQAFRQRHQLGFVSVGNPRHAAIGPDATHDSFARAFQGPNAVANTEVCGFAEGFDAARHGIPVEHAGHVMGGERGRFPAARQRQVGEQNINQPAGNFSEGVAVEEKKRRGAMTAEKEIESFEKGQRLVARFFPLPLNLRVSFRIMAVLSASSFARSAVEADDRLPTPVLDKRGSGL